MCIHCIHVISVIKNMAKKTNLIIKGNVSYSAEISDSLAARIISMCANEVGNPTSTSAPHSSQAHFSEDVSSISEYMDQLKPKRNPDKILTIAVYMTTKKSQKYFTPQEIKPYFSKASESIPANFTRDFNWTLTTKWLSEADDKRGMYFVTKKGLKVIEDGFPKDLVKETRGKSAGRKTVKRNSN